MPLLLTNLTNVKGWLSATQAGDDALLQRLIGSCSQAIFSYLQRHNVYKAVYTEILDGVGSTRISLKNFPVLSVSSLSVAGQPIAASGTPYDGGTPGYSFDPWDGYSSGAQNQFLSLRGYSFPMGYSNISVTYTAGYVVQNEAATIPASSAYTITPQAPYGAWMVDEGVTFAPSGTALTKVTGAPAAGQYSVSSTGVYTFNAANAGTAVLLSYSFVPSDLEQACIEMVAERYRYRSRIGEKSKSLGGQETISFDNSALNDYTKMLLNPFKSVLF